VTGPVLVTGAAGFAGGHLLELLAGRGAVTAFTRSAPPANFLRLARWFQVDLLDRDAVRRAIAEIRPARIFHCAGAPHIATSWKNTAYALQANVLTTHHLFEALRLADVGCRVVVAGSAAVYAPTTEHLRENDVLRPVSPYGVSKLAQEQLSLLAGGEPGVEVIVTRSFNHTGPRQAAEFAAPSMARQVALIERGAVPPVLHVGNLDTVRDITDVRDMVRAYALLMEHGRPGSVYNVGSGVGRPIRAVVDALLSRSATPVEFQVDQGRLRPSDTPVVVGDPGKLREATGWEPAIGFDRMIDDLLAYWRQRTAEDSAPR
jgi:GDP-4-dehydro-6-deoxy-D-mannose reductase